MQPRLRGIMLTVGLILAIAGILLTSSEPVQQHAVAEVNEAVAVQMLAHQATDASIAAVAEQFADHGVDPMDPRLGHDAPRPRTRRDEGQRLVEEALVRTARTPFALGIALTLVGAGMFGLALPSERKPSP